MADIKDDDMPSHEILFFIKVAGSSYTKIDQKYGLPKGTAVNTARQPHPRGELAISEVIKLPPQIIWPSRYDRSTGERLSPQPMDNYRTQAMSGPRQNVTPEMTCGAAA